MISAHFIRHTLSVLVLAAATAFSPPAQAAVQLSGLDHLNKAIQDFIVRLDESKKTKMPPRLSNSQDAPVLEALWDVPAIIGNAPYLASDLPVLMDIIQQQAQVSKAYVMFSPDPQKQADTERNSTAFQDEISRSSAAMISFIAAALEAAGDYTATLKTDGSDKARSDSIIKLRLSLQQVINGTALMLRNPELNAHNQERLALALADNAAAITKAISLQDRTMLINVVKGAQPVLRDTARTSADRFITALENKDCTGLCALH